MSATLEHLKELVLETAPALHSTWVQAETGLRKDSQIRPQPTDPLERQPVYAQECRDLLASATAPGTRDHDLRDGFSRKEFTVPSKVDGFQIPVLQLELDTGLAAEGKTEEQGPGVIVIYYHGGGLRVGEADSEEFSCRRIVKSAPARVKLYSVGYRLMPQNSANTCISDAIDGFNALRSDQIPTVVVGSSSGGQLAATVAQTAPQGAIHGLLLRCPATCDPSQSKVHIPEWLRPFHTSRDQSFATFIFDKSKNSTAPWYGLPDLPLQASTEQFGGYPKTWIQLCSNDNLYSDGLCLGMALVAAGVEVRVDVWEGWPHTFWLKTPQLQEAFDADLSMLRGLRWLLE